MTGPPEAAAVEAMRGAYAHCFACGRENPMGLRLDGFARDGGDVVAGFRPRPEYAGFHGVLHGGIVATALDEIMAWAAIMVEGVFSLTGTMELRFRRPAEVATDYELRGRVDERRGRRLLLSGEMNAGGKSVAEGSGLYLVRNELPAP